MYVAEPREHSVVGSCGWRVARIVAVLAILVALPSLAHAQTALAGTVRDASGAVLPGVTVEASSPVLIEKVRSAVSDGTGQYRITELPPGTYSVTFTLPGFAIVKRDGVELSGAGVTTMNAELRVGSVEETITVTGETPVVDVQSTRRQEVIDDDTLKALPATRGYNALIFLVPSITGSSNQIDLMPKGRECFQTLIDADWSTACFKERLRRNHQYFHVICSLPNR